MHSLLSFPTVLAAALIGLSGCGGGGIDKSAAHQVPVTPVSGVVSFNGIPLAEATVTFRSRGSSPAASGITDSQGEFRLTTYKGNDGAAVGDYQVSVSKFEVVVPPPGYHSDTSPSLPDPKPLVPNKYLDFGKSELKATVTSAGPNRINFDLTSK